MEGRYNRHVLRFQREMERSPERLELGALVPLAAREEKVVGPAAEEVNVPGRGRRRMFGELVDQVEHVRQEGKPRAKEAEEEEEEEEESKGVAVQPGTSQADGGSWGSWWTRSGTAGGEASHEGGGGGGGGGMRGAGIGGISDGGDGAPAIRSFKAVSVSTVLLKTIPNEIENCLCEIKRTSGGKDNYVIVGQRLIGVRFQEMGGRSTKYRKCLITHRKVE